MFTNIKKQSSGLFQILRKSHTLKKNLTKLFQVQKEKKENLKIFLSSLLHGKNHETWNVNSNITFQWFYVKKQYFSILWKKDILRPEVFSQKAPF